MVRVLNLFVIDRRFEPQSSQTDDFTGVCCFSAKESALRNEGKDCWLGIRIIYLSGTICLHLGCFITVSYT